MAEKWFYRMFGEEFGPVAFEELKELADHGSLSPTDEVRAADSNEWTPAALVEQLGLKLEDSPGQEADIDAFFETKAPAEVSGESQATKAVDEWFCMIGGAELGPLTFEELTEYAQNEQLSADDEVKLGQDGKWRRVGSIGRLMAVMPYKAVEKSIVPKPPKPKTPAFEQPVIDDFETDLTGGGEEVIEFEDLSSLVTDSTEPVRSAPAPVAAPDTKAAFHAAYEEAKAKIAESMMAQAEASFKASEEQAKSQVAWASAPNVDRQWWGWASGVEFGPVEFTQVFGLAKSGQLRPTDLVRNGQFNQFGAASNVPGLFNAVAMIARATETLNLARTQAQAAVALALPLPNVPDAILTASASVTPRVESAPRMASPAAVQSDPNINTVASKVRGPNFEAISRMQMSASVEPAEEERVARPMAAPEPRREMRPEPRPEPRPVSYSPPVADPYGGMSASSSSVAQRPITVPKKPVASARSGGSMFSGLFESLQDPNTMKVLGIFTVVLLVVGWNFLPKSKAQDIKHYKTLKKLYDDIRASRNNPSELNSLMTKGKAIAKEVHKDLEKKASTLEPAKQCLLWAARDEFPRACQAGFTTESTAEKMFAARLQEASYLLGLEVRPKVPPSAIQNAPLPDD